MILLFSYNELTIEAIVVVNGFIVVTYQTSGGSKNIINMCNITKDLKNQ
jgi:hypothetical protein